MSKPCNWCGVTIFWSEEPQGYVPYENEALTKRHDCPKKPIGVPRPGPGTSSAPGASGTQTTSATSNVAKKVLVKPLTDDEIIFVRKLRWQLKGLTEGATAP